MAYTPNGILIQPGYVSSNPYDTGRSGERNAELNSGQKDTQSGWDYDAGRPYPGAVQQSDGRWVMAGGGGGGGGGGDLMASPYYQQYLAASQAAGSQDLADTQAMLQDLFVTGGFIPEGYQDKLGFLSETVRKLIEQNTKSGISQYARLLEGKADTLRETINRLAARGLSRSGTKAYRLKRNQTDYDRNLSDFVTALMGNARQLQSGYAGREGQRQMNLAQFLANLAASWSGGGSRGNVNYTPPVPATPAFDWGSYTPQQQMSTWQDFVQSDYSPGEQNNPLWENPLPQGGYNHQTFGPQW